MVGGFFLTLKHTFDSIESYVSLNIIRQARFSIGYFEKHLYWWLKEEDIKKVLSLQIWIIIFKFLY